MRASLRQITSHERVFGSVLKTQHIQSTSLNVKEPRRVRLEDYVFRDLGTPRKTKGHHGRQRSIMVPLSAMEVERVVVLIGQGERLPANSDHDDFLKGSLRVFAQPVEVENGKALMNFLKNLGPQTGESYVRQVYEGSYIWERLQESSQSIPRLGNQVVVYQVLPARGLTMRVEPVAFSELPRSSPLPFKGRDEVMQSVACEINNLYEAFQSDSISRENMLFVAFEGLAGVGKTRCLVEILHQTPKYLPAQAGLSQLYRLGAVQGTYITFNGSAMGNRHSHALPKFIVQMAEGLGCAVAGRLFMRACIVSEVIYATPLAELPKDLQEEILAEDDKCAMRKVADHIRQGCKLSHDQLLVLFLLIDESQLLAKMFGANGVDFVRGMFAMVGEFMTSTAGMSEAKECKLVLVPALAGTVLPVGGHFGISDWQKCVQHLDVLHVDSALETLRESLNSSYFDTYAEEVMLLLEDCSCLPRLVKYIYDAWSRNMDSGMSEFVTYLRTSMVVAVQTWVQTILSGNRAAVKRMLRLCLTGDVVEEHGDMEMGECLKGYVSWIETDGGYKYQVPAILLHALACKLQIHNNVVLLRPEPAKGETLELAFLDALHARLCLNAGMDCSVSKLFPGAYGQRSLCQTNLKVGKDVLYAKEKFQFVNSTKKQFYNVDDGLLETEDGQVINLPSADLLTKVRSGGYAVDGRLFLLASNGTTMYEFWIQMRGQKDRFSKDDVKELVDRAFEPQLDVQGRKKVYVLICRSGFSFSGLGGITRDVLLLDAGGMERCLPGFLRRCGTL